MNTVKNILIGMGIIFLVMVLSLVILGVKIIGTILFWILCIIAVIWLIVWIAYLVGRAGGGNQSSS